MSASRTSLDGTWKPVYLASRNADHIVRACIHSDNSGKVKATVFLHRPIIEDCELLVEILEFLIILTMILYQIHRVFALVFVNLEILVFIKIKI